ncbi:hypothetical protein LJR084_006671 [Variovorax sp. LjRoot84]|uniref:hypothetical protein n=1 Tax=Variovorax sp. LjRoot84 TaxID=3342340 RepID=UPI003ED0653B
MHNGSALPCSISGEAAMEPLVLLAEIVPAAQYLTLGLVQEVVDDAGPGRAGGSDLRACVAVVADLCSGHQAWWKEMGDELFARAATAGAYLGARKFTKRKPAAVP